MKPRIAVASIALALAVAPLTGHAADKPAEKTPLSRVTEITDDATITAKVKAELAKNKAVRALAINVDTKKGVVTLSGSAKSKEEADKAVELARNTGGVASVKNELKIGASTK